MKTQTQIAAEVGVTQQAISAYVNGIARPKYKVMQRLLIAVPGSTPQLWMEGGPGEIQSAIDAATDADAKAA